MRRTPIHHRCPRAGIDPIDDAATALAVVELAIHRPLRAETIAVLLDDDRCGVGIIVVADTVDPDAVVEVVELVAGSAATGGRVSAIVVASVRPARVGEPGPRQDVDRWLEMSEIADAAGIELIEWFVVARGISCPRDRLGEPPRW